MPLIALIGDLVESRKRRDRRRLQKDVRDRLDELGTTLSLAQPLEMAVGDEFQGVFRDLAEATRATLLIRLDLLIHARIDARFGLGEGEVTVFDPRRTPVSQDGSAWWAARAGIERAKTLSAASRTSGLRTCLGYGRSEADESSTPAIDAFLFCRDELVTRMNHRQQRLLLGVMLGRSQDWLAEDEGITQSAVSQALHRSGAFVVDAAQKRLFAEP